MLFQYRLNAIIFFLLLLATITMQSRNSQPVTLAVSPTDSGQHAQLLPIKNFGNVSVIAKTEMQFPHLSELEKIFAPGQVQQSPMADLLTSWISCIAVLVIIFLLFRIDPSRPFLPEIANIIKFLGYVVFSLMVFDNFRNIYFDKLVRATSQGMYKLDRLNRIFPVLFLSGAILWLGRTIKKAAILQKENDLTI